MMATDTAAGANSIGWKEFLMVDWFPDYEYETIKVYFNGKEYNMKDKKDRKKLKRIKWEEKQEFRFAKLEKKYATPDLKAYLERYPALKYAYRNVIYARAEVVRDERQALFAFIISFVFLALALVTTTTLFGAGIFLGVGMFNCVCAYVDRLREEMLLFDFYNEVKFQSYDVVLEMVREAAQKVKEENEKKQTNAS